MEETKKEKLTFFQRLKIAIFNLEDYGKFLKDGPTEAFKYFFTIILISCLITVACDVYLFSELIFKTYNYIESEIPEFSYENGILNFSEYVEGFDKKYDFRFIANTGDITDEEKNTLKNKVTESSSGLLLLNNSFFLILQGEEIEEDYKSLENSLNYSIISKSDLTNINKNSLIISVGLAELFASYIFNILEHLSMLCFIAIIGFIISRFCGITLKMMGSIELSIYSMSLSIVLYTIYLCVNRFTGFTIQYFELIYLLIAFIYLIASFYMIKFDLLKEKEELNQIYEVQEAVKKELEEEEDKKEEDTNKDNSENDSNKEENEGKEDDSNGDKKSKDPDGSEI